MTEQLGNLADGDLVHKANSRPGEPLVSLVLLDWECRERFHTLDWLNRQDAPATNTRSCG